jgi:TrmH family RNA methyltransferase
MISSPQNSLVKYLVHLRENKQFRAQQGRVLITGEKLVKELAMHVHVHRIFVLHPLNQNTTAEVITVTGQVLKKITGLPTPEGIAAEVSLPLSSALQGRAPILVLDAIRDPGNLGTLLRTALALNWAGAFFLPSCVDYFSDKVIRSSRGALFKLPWREGNWEELENLKHQENLKAFVADLNGTPLTSQVPERKALLLLSNESKGTSTQAKQFGQKVTIPLTGDMESLNVAIAGGILMYYLKNG